MSCDTAFVRIDRPADQVFAFLADPANLSLWSFGTWSVELDETGLVHGRSIKDGSKTLVRVDPHPELGLIDYLIGKDPDNLSPRIFVRIVPGAVLGGSDLECGLTMTAFRTDAMDDRRWSEMKTTHAFEVQLIRSAIETGYDHRRQGD